MLVLIRPEAEADHAAIHTVNRAAFPEEAEADLVDALRRNPAAFVPELSLVAELQGEVIGHILFTRIQIVGEDGREVESLALAPMAVLPAHQKSGVGSALVRHGLKKAGALGFRSVIVLGHEHYYPRFGFREAATWGINAPFEVPSGDFMALELVPGALQGVSGTVRYAKQFEGV